MSPDPYPAAREDLNPVATLLVGAAVPALLAVGVLALAGAVVSLDAAASVLVGGAMGLAAMLVGPGLHRFCRNLDPSFVLGIAVLAYFTVIGLLGFGYSLVNGEPWLIGGFAGGGLLAATLGWAVGHLRAAIRLREPLYQDGQATAGR